MKLKGLQKTTLIDYPNRIACTLFLYGCNFRCGFCHNPELVIENDNKDIFEEDFFNFLEKRKDYLEGVCITGGEPLVSLKKEFLKKIKDLGYEIKIDTNGSFPEKLEEFIKENLVDFVAMDIKSSKERYNEITGVGVDISKIEKSIKLISTLENYEFRTTVIRDFHNQEEIKKIAEWIKELTEIKPKKFVLQAFKNNGKFISKIFENEKDVQEEELTELKKIIKHYFEEVEIRG